MHKYYFIITNKQLTIIAKITAIDEYRDLVKRELLKLINITRTEKVVLITIYTKITRMKMFFYKNWESRDLWQQYMSSLHLANDMKVTDGTVKEFTLNGITVDG